MQYQDQQQQDGGAPRGAYVPPALRQQMMMGYGQPMQQAYFAQVSRQRLRVEVIFQYGCVRK